MLNACVDGSTVWMLISSLIVWYMYLALISRHFEMLSHVQGHL